MKRVATIVAVNVGIFVLLWLGLEAGARAFAPRDLRAVFNDPTLRSGPLVVPDSARGFTLKPGYSSGWLNINSAGFRGAELPADLSSRTVLLAMGESSTFGWGVPDSATCPARLQRALEQIPGMPPSWVINGGVPSYTSPQVLLYVKQLLPRYRPSVVFVSILWNDVLYSCLGNWMPEYLVQQRPAAWRKFLLDHSAVYRALVIKDPVAAPATQVRNPRALRYYVQNMEAIVRECRKAGVPVVLVRPPLDRSRIRDEGMRIGTGIVPKTTFLALLDDFFGALDAVAQKTGVPYVQGFSVAGEEPSDLFLDPVHLNAAGNQRLAELEAKLLAEAGLLPKR